MEWIEKEVSGKWLKSYVANHDGITLTINLRRHEYENAGVQIWDAIMVDGQINIGRAVILGEKGDKEINPDTTFEKAIPVMREHLMGKLDYHRANYQKWKFRSARFEGMTL